MSNYTQVTFFAPKDLLITGNPAKLVKGSEVDPEFLAISTAIATKADTSGGTIFFADGSAGSPSITFVNDTNTGLYRSAADQLAITTGGVARVLIANTFIDLSVVQVQAGDGLVGTPAVSFLSDPDTGLYRVGANSMAFAAGGVRKFSVDSAFIQSDVQHTMAAGILNSDGLAGTPAFSFSADPDTGFYRDAGNSLRIVAGGSSSATFTATVMSVNAPALRIEDGAVGSPAWAFSTDTDTGFYRLAANDVAVSAGNSIVEDWFNDGTVVGSRFSKGIYLNNTISPAQLTVSTNDYTPASGANANRIRLNASTPLNITGLATSQQDGRRITLFNTSISGITLIHESGSSTAANRFNLASATNAVLNQFGSITLVYDGSLGRWTAEDRS